MALPAVHAPVREVTEDEVALFRENGWAALPGLVAADFVAGLKARALVRFHERQGRFRNSFVDQAFGQDRDIAAHDEAFAALSLSPELGRNVVRLLVGVESGSNEMLKRIRKDIRIEQVFQIAEKMLKYDIAGHFPFIVGFPDESDSSIQAPYHLTGRHA